MSNRAERSGKALSLLIVFAMVAGGLFAIALALSAPAHAGTCDQVAPVITGNWIVTTAQVCTGISYTIDGQLYIRGTGSLTLVDGGITFSEDVSHLGSLWIDASGALVLDNSFVSTQTNLLSPFLKLRMTVNGTLAMRNGAVLKFPGAQPASGLTFNSGAVFNMTASKITGFSDSEIQNLGTAAWIDDNDDSPIISMTGATAYLYQSRIEKIYENSQGGSSDNVTLANSALYAYDSYIGVDYADTWDIHNVLNLDTNSQAFIYNVTIDEVQSDAVPPYQQLPGFVPAGSGAVYILRWLHATVADSFGSPVIGATIWSRVSPGTTTAQYPDNGNSNTPSQTTLWYLGRTGLSGAMPWNTTGAYGAAVIPLWTDTITSSSLPNAISFGDYQEEATYQSYNGGAGVSFAPYPDLTVANNNKDLTIALGSAILCPSPVTVWDTENFQGTVSLSGSLEIAGAVTIRDGGVYLDQQANSCSYVKVRSGGALTLINAKIWSNYALPVNVLAGGALAASEGSQLLLTQGGTPGLLRSDGTTSTVSLTDTTVDGNVQLTGASASLIRDTFLGPGLSIDTASKTRLWDASLPGVTDLDLATDLGSNSSVAFDIRNVTFNDQQTSELKFAGTQYAQLTNVQLFDPTGTWYLSMISGNAVVARYSWLTINAVDGTGTLLADANASIMLSRVDPRTLNLYPADASGGLAPGDNIFGTSSTSWPAATPSGSVLYKAFMESRTATPGGRVLNNSYVANGTAFLQGTTYYSDSDAQVLVTDNSVAELSFSSLTPDLSVTLLQATLGGVTSTFQPVNTNITLTATIRNTGQIDVRNVDVAFFLTNVDANGDGLLDSPTDSFRTSALIGERIIPTVPKSGTITVSVYWTPPGTFETSVPVSVVVDPPLANPADGGAIRETNELNNILVSPLTLFTWPDLAITPADLALLADAVVDNNVPIQVSVHNFGTNTATEATLQFFEAGIPITTPLTITVTAGSTASLVVTWRPSAVGVHNLYAIATTKNDTVRNKDYVFDNNVANMTVNVVTQPDLVLLQSDYAATKNAQQDVAFAITVVVRNEGQTPAANTSVEVYLNGNRSLPWGRAGNVSVLAGSQTNVTVLAKGIPTPSTVHLMMVVDPDNLLNEGGSAEENNNFANLTVIVQPPTGQVNIGTPNNGTVYQPSDTILVQGVVRDNAENGIANLGLNLTVMQNGQPITGMGQTATTDSAGSFAFQVSLVSLADGDYVIRVAPAQQSVASSDATFSVHRNVPFLNQPVPILGIPWWLMLVILAAAAAVIIGVTVYFKVYGLGKMVECGECGAFIPEDATTCPKCGVEFERDMAKCSNCQAWIPVDVKQCPECGVEFATGQVEMADYQEKMRLQYDEVVQKFKEEASRQLGRSLSDREFQDWWRKQPTFVTFEDWLREEEEMRKMGSKPCPVCGTLNSVTATVCHKCGSLLKEQPRPPSGGAGGVPPVARQAAQPSPTATGLQAPPSGGTQAVVPQGQETIPRRVIRKPVSQQPVVQKRVIKRPLGEGQQGESTEGGEGQATDEEKTEDEL